MVEMTVSGVILDAQSKHPIVMLRDREERRALLIWIGDAEATAILMALEGVKLPRPLTHDLLKHTFESLGCVLKEIRITAMKDQTFFAEIVGEQGGQATSLDARPSDAIALALRAEVPVFVDEAVLTEHAVPINPEREAEEEDTAFREFLKDLKPNDFQRFSKD